MHDLNVHPEKVYIKKQIECCINFSVSQVYFIAIGASMVRVRYNENCVRGTITLIALTCIVCLFLLFLLDSKAQISSCETG